MMCFVITYCCTLQASHIKRALRRLRPDFSEICLASSGGRSRPSFLQTDVRTLHTWPTGNREDVVLIVAQITTHFKWLLIKISTTSTLSCLFCARQRNSDSQTTAPNRADDFGGGGGAQDETASAHVLFHCSAQSVLGIFRESVHLC